MPETQTYGTQKVAAEATPEVRDQVESTAEDYGAGPSSQALQREAIDLFQREKQNADQVAVLGADAAFRDKQNDILYNQQTGVMNKQGKDALGIADEAGSKMRAALGDIQNSLSDPAQRTAFQRMAQSRLEESDKIMQVHSRQQFQKYDTELTESSVANEQNSAIQNYGDQDAVNLSIARSKAMFEDFGNRHGMPKEWIEEKQNQATSNIQSGIITRMLDNGNDIAAKKYYDANKDDIQGDQVAAVEKQLEIGSTRGQSTRLADKIFNDDNVDTIRDAYDKTAKISDPKIRIATEERLDKLYAIQAQADRQDRETASSDAMQIVHDTKDVNQVPAETLAKLTPNEVMGLSRYSKSLITGSVNDDPNIYYAYEAKATNPDKVKEFVNQNLMELRPVLNDQHFNALLNLQKQMREKKGSAPGELNEIRTQQSVVNSSLQAAGIDPLDDSNKETWTQANNFRSAVQTQVDQFKARNNRPPSPDEIQDMSDNLMVKSITDRGAIWNSRTPSFKVPANQPLDYDLKDIPINDLRQIKQALGARGIVPTESKIIETYIQAQNRRLGRNANGQ